MKEQINFYKKLLKFKDFKYTGRLESYYKVGFCKFLPSLENWDEYLEKSFYEIQALEYFKDKYESFEKLIWENNKQINKKTYIGKISLLDELNQLLYYLNNEKLVPINLERIKGLSKSSYKRFSDISLPGYSRLKSIVLISYKKVTDKSETIKYYPNSHYKDIFSEEDLLNKNNIKEIYLNYGEILIINPKLICNFEQIIKFKFSKCIFYNSTIKKFTLKDTEKNIFFNEVKTKEHPFIDDTKLIKLSKYGLFGRYKNHAIDLHQYGFTKIPKKLINDPEWINLIDTARNKLILYMKKKNIDSTKGIRFQDAWKHQNIKEIKEIASHPEILIALKVLFGKNPFPFQTLNFPKGSAQHVHSDATHFSSLPKGFMCGVWVALEDIHPDSGCLEYYPFSHKEPYLSAKSIGLKNKDVMEEKAPQKFFEKLWDELIKSKNYKKKLFCPKKGDLLIWHANLLHGGSKIKNPSLSRWSQVSHYYFYGCKYINPFYDTSDRINDDLFIRKAPDLLNL